MSRPLLEGKPIDTPSASDYIQQVKTFFQDDPVSEPGHRVLELIQGLAVTARAAYADVKRDVEEISMALRRNPKLVRDLNAVLPCGFVVQCPVVQHLMDVTILEYLVLDTSDGGQILSTSGSDGVGVPCPSSTRELRVTLPLKDEWQTIQTMCSNNEFEDPRIDEDYKRVVSRRQIHLAKLTRILPPSLFIHNLVRLEAIYHSDYGGFADIAKATIKATPVCLKILRVYSNEDDGVKKSKAFFREVLLWSRLSHPNILPFLGAQVSEGLRFVLISPWMNNGNLRTFLKANPDHDRLRAVNVLVKDDLQCCLADFGLSSIAGSQRLESKSFAGEGTMRWQAPEVVLSDSSEFEKRLDSAAADVYAYGCTVLEVYTGNYPFHGLKDFALIRAHMDKKKPRFPDATDFNISREFRALVCSCWNSAPERPTISDISSNLEAEIASREAPGPSTFTQPSDEGYLANNVTEQSTSTEYTARKQSTSLEPNVNPLTQLDEWKEPAVGNRVDFSGHYHFPSSLEGSYDQHRSRITSSNVLKTEDPPPVLATPGPAKITCNGLATPPANDHVSVDPVPSLVGLELRLTEEPEVMKHAEDLAPRLPVGIRTDNLLTPPETPTLSPGRPQPFSESPIRFSPDSPVFIPRTGVKPVKPRNLSIDAAEFRPTKFLRTSTLQNPMTVTSAAVATPATPISPLARYSSLSQSLLNANAVEFTPTRHSRSPIGDHLPPLSAALEELETKTNLHKQESPVASHLNPNAPPFNFSAAT